jgi:hypothetical protein
MRLAGVGYAGRHRWSHFLAAQWFSNLNDIVRAGDNGLWLTANTNNTPKPKRISPAAATKTKMGCRPARLPDTKTSSSGETKLTNAFL